MAKARQRKPKQTVKRSAPKPPRTMSREPPQQRRRRRTVTTTPKPAEAIRHSEAATTLEAPKENNKAFDEPNPGLESPKESPEAPPPLYGNENYVSDPISAPPNDHMEPKAKATPRKRDADDA